MNINIDPQLVRTFGLYGGLLAGKMLVMAPLTGRQRIKKKASDFKTFGTTRTFAKSPLNCMMLANAGIYEP